MNHIKWFPHARSTAIIVAARSHHFSLPLKMHRPRIKRNIEIAPIYIGPAVNGCGPQYRGRCLITWLRFGCPACFRSLYVSDFLSSAPEDAPPLKFGIIRFGVSSMPYDQAVAYSRSSPLSLCVSDDGLSSEPPRIVCFAYWYVGMSLLRLVAMPVPPITSRSADAAKNFTKRLSAVLDKQTETNCAIVYMRIMMAR